MENYRGDNVSDSKLYCETICDILEKELNNVREKYYSRNIFKKFIYKNFLQKLEKDYSNSILKLEKLINMEYNLK